VPPLSPLVAAVLVGAIAVNARLLPAAAAPGTEFAARRLLRVGVILLGFQLPVGRLLHLGSKGLAVVLAVVVCTFFGTQLLGRLLRVKPALSLLVATGFSICGASAIAAMRGVVPEADEEEVAYSIALVTLCGTLAIGVLPLLRGPLGLDEVAFGSWSGASVHDVAQVVATASTAGSAALSAAIVVKLSRVVLLGPLVAGVTVYRRIEGRHDPNRAERPPLVPLFVAGFLAAVAVRSVGVLPGGALDALRIAETLALAAALVGLGAAVRIEKLRRVGGRPLALGLLSWILVAVVAYAGVRISGS
jgi:uncharacterized integral membrane protein (TIGR00698 family)